MSTHPLTARRVVACVLAIVAGYVAFAVYGQAAHGRDLEATAAQLAQQNDVLQQHISDDQGEISQAQTSAWLTEQARRLGYTLPGEKVYVLVTPGATPYPASGGIDAKLPTLATPSASPSPSGTPAAAGQSAAPTPTSTPTPYVITLPQPSPKH